MPSITSQHCEE